MGIDLKDIDIEKFKAALEDPEVKAKMDKITEEFLLKLEQERNKPKFQKNDCMCCNCRKY